MPQAHSRRRARAQAQAQAQGDVLMAEAGQPFPDNVADIARFP